MVESNLTATEVVQTQKQAEQVYKMFRMSSRNKLGIPPHCRFSTLLQY